MNTRHTCGSWNCRRARLHAETGWINPSNANGGYLNPKLVRQARQEEINEIHNYKVYEKRPAKECLEVTGKKPMAIRWVDTNKGDEENSEYRSRIVAKDLKTRRDPSMPAIDTFAPMPALEMIKLLLILAATWSAESYASW